MTNNDPTILMLQQQYLATRQEADQCRSYSTRYQERADGADANASSLAGSIVALGGEVPTWPVPAPEPDEATDSAEAPKEEANG